MTLTVAKRYVLDVVMAAEARVKELIAEARMDLGLRISALNHNTPSNMRMNKTEDNVAGHESRLVQTWRLLMEVRDENVRAHRRITALQDKVGCLDAPPLTATAVAEAARVLRESPQVEYAIQGPHDPRVLVFCKNCKREM